MKVRKSKAAILVESRQPLVVDEFDLPSELGIGQVLVKIHTTSICGAPRSGGICCRIRKSASASSSRSP